MNRTAAAAAIAVAAIACTASPSLAQAPDSASTWQARGLYLGTHLSAGTFNPSADERAAYGSGAGVSLGYLFTPKVGVELSGSGAFFDDLAGDSFLLGHTDLLLHYRFASAERRWTPSLHAGTSWRTSRAVERSDDDLVISGARTNGALSFGAGVSYAAAPGFTLQGQVTRTAGNIAGDGCPVNGGQKSCARSDRLSLGLQWHPRGR